MCRKDLNPQYVWGGDAITLDGTDKVWIDHCKCMLIYQHIAALQYANYISMKSL